MKIVHVITRLILGGAQENTLLTCKGQAERGHEVYLLAGPAVGPEGSMAQRAEAVPGLTVETVPDLVRNVRPWRDWRALKHLKQRLAGLAPDVVHTHSLKAGILGREAAAKACPDSLLVHTIHGSPFYPGQNPLVRRLYAALERRAGRQADALISVCDAMTEEALGHGIGSPEKFTTVYSGMEVERFLRPAVPVARIREELDLPAEALVIVKVARLFHLKGHADVLQAFARLAEHHPTLYLLFVGDGPLRDSLERRARRLNVHRLLRFAGLVAPERVPSLIHASDILVHASLREGLARVLPQALLSGRPAVSYDVGGAREVIRPGETGCLVTPGDREGLGRAIESLVSDRTMRQRMGERGRALCAERFDHRKMVDAIEDVYARVLERRRAAEK